MKKQLLKIFTTLFACSALAFGFSACKALHEHAYTAVVSNPTCTERGYTTYTCECGDSYIDDYVDMLEHEFTYYVSNGDATCGKDGTETAICNRLGCNERDTRTEEDSALEHDFTNYVSNGDATCERNGTETAKCNHTGCNETHTRREKDSALGHEFTNYVSNGDATCTKNGTETASCNHTGCNETRTRTKKNSSLGHEFTNYVSNGDATCTKNGTETAKCNRTGCNETHTRAEKNSAFGHEFTNYVSNGDATCTKDGTETAKCNHAGCNETYTRTEEGTMLSHTYDQEIAKEKYLESAATCTRKAKYYYSCVCGKKGTETFEYGEFAAHPAEIEWKYNETHHWHNSTCDCNVKVDFAQHTLEDSGWCTVCENFVLPTNGVYYDVSDDGTYAEVIAYKSTSTKVKIADTYEGLPVANIYDNAFKNTAIVSVIIPDSVTSIGNFAFSGCSGLTSITIPDSVTSIGASAFSGCSRLEEIMIPFVGEKAGKTSNDAYQYPFGFIFGPDSYAGGKATQQSYRSSVSVYTRRTYYIPITLKKVTVTGGNILYGAFSGCSGLTSVTIGDRVTSIGERAFYGCSGLTSVTIPNSVTSIGASAFSGCSGVGLTSVYYGGTIDEWVQITFSGDTANPLFFAKKLYIDNKLVTEANITTATKISLYAFHGCSGLTSVTIGDSVTSIGYDAFSYCSGLTSITIPDSVTSIGGSAFSYCSGLTSVTIPNNVRVIGDGAFKNCIGLEKVIWNAENCTSAGDLIFSDCSNLTKIIIGENVKNISYCAILDCISLQYNTFGELNYLGNEKNPYMVVVSPISKNFRGYEISSTAKIILGNAFKDCARLTSIMIPDSVTLIGESAFEGCSGLTSVMIGDSVTSIGFSAFYNCSGLTSITIPDSVTRIDSYAFYNCSGLTSIIFKDTSTWYRDSSDTNGIKTSVTDSSSNVTYFTSTYCNYYWYKE